MKRLTREAVQNAAATFETDDIEVPAWGVVVEVRSLSGAEVQRVNKMIESGEFDKDPFAVMVQVVADCAEPFETIEEVLDLDFRGILQLARGIMKYSGMSLFGGGDIDADDLEDAAREIFDEVEGNSETTPS